MRLANVLHEAAREEDLVARLGGDEFVILVERVNRAEAQQIARRIIAAVRAAPAHESGWRVTASIGLTMARSGQGVSEVLSEADAAMYRAKQGGRDRASQ